MGEWRSRVVLVRTVQVDITMVSVLERKQIVTSVKQWVMMNSGILAQSAKVQKKWSVCEDTQRTDDGKCNKCDSDWGEIKPCKVCLDMPYGTPDWRTTHRMPPADPVNFDGSYYLGNAGKGFGLPLDKNDPTTPA